MAAAAVTKINKSDETAVSKDSKLSTTANDEKLDENTLAENDLYWNCILYTNEDFTGESVCINGDCSWSDEKSLFKSLKINRGVWFCYDKPDFQGKVENKLYGKHKLSDIGSIRSMRYIEHKYDSSKCDSATTPLNAYVGDGDTPPPPSPPTMIVTFENQNYNGLHHRAFVQSHSNLQSITWSGYSTSPVNAISSVWRIGGTWILYQGTNQSGLSTGEFTSSYATMPISVGNNTISSVQLIQPSPPPP